MIGHFLAKRNLYFRFSAPPCPKNVSAPLLYAPGGWGLRPQTPHYPYLVMNSSLRT